MIPDEIAKFVNDVPIIAMMGTRDANLVPRVHRLWGCRVEGDGEHLSAWVPAYAAASFDDTLRDNGQVALTLVEPVSHEAYQFKGEHVASDASTPDDLALFEAYKQRLIKHMNEKLCYPAEVMEMAITPPAVTVRIKVREVYLQTPGPGAGKRIAPEEP